MGDFFGTFKNVTPRDELFGGGDGIPVSLRNIEVASDTTIQRGMLLASDKMFGTFSLATNSETSRVFVVAASGFTSTSDSFVTQAYSSGKFNREKIILGENLNLDDFEPELRKQNIHLTSIKNIFGHVDDVAIGN